MLREGQGCWLYSGLAQYPTQSGASWISYFAVSKDRRPSERALTDPDADVSYHESSLASSKHVAVCSILKAAADGIPIPYQGVLTPHQNKAVRLSSEIEALLKPLKPLLTIASFFQVPIGLWEDVRKTWCNEVLP
jgi:hypothetical protein